MFLIQFQHVNSELSVNNCKTLQVRADNRSLKMWFEKTDRTLHARALAGGGGGGRDTDRTQLRSWENKNSPAGPGRREETAGQAQADMMDVRREKGLCETVSVNLPSSSLQAPQLLSSDWDKPEMSGGRGGGDCSRLGVTTLQHSNTACRPTLVTLTFTLSDL